jgi:predicted acetyltransferase
LLELLGLLKSLSDQVYSVSLFEPAQIQLQSLLAKPLRNQSITKNSKHKNDIRAFAWWQARVLDVCGCVSVLSSLSGKVAFNLKVADPLDEYATQDLSGIGGEYVVTLGEGGGAELGKDATLPQLNCDVNALTRLLMAVAPAISLAVTDDLAAPAELLTQLDEVLRLPKPITGWEF